MAFKLNNPPFHMDNTPIYRVDMEDGVMGKANNNGSITINKDLHPDRSRKCSCSRKNSFRTNGMY